MMEALGKLVAWLSTNAGILSIGVTILVAVIPAMWSFVRYLNLKNKELAHERFKIYHELIRSLVQPDTQGQPMYMDRQIAVVFELRNFPEYYELTMRMLEGLEKSWGKQPQFERLVGEMDLTIEHIRKNSKLKPNKAIQTDAQECR